MRSRDGGRDASPTEETREGSSHVPIQAERSTLYSQAPPLGRSETTGDGLGRPLGRNEAVRPRDGAGRRPLRERPLNREALSDRLAPPPVPQRTTDHPEQPVERSKHDSQTNPEDGDARIDDEPLHHEADRTVARVTTTRKPMLGPQAARVVERARERDAIAESHFNLTFHVEWVGWHVAVIPCHTISYEVNALLLQYALNRLNILLILAGNANVALDLAVTILKNFELKRDTIQTENDVPAR